MILFISLGLLSVARCESEENALVTCSLKSGDVESAKIPRAQCLILIDLFNAQDKELDFIAKNDTSEMGYCVDVKCLTTRFSENVPRVQKSPRRTKTSAKAKKATRNTESRKNEQKLVQGKITSTDIPVSLLADEAEHNAEHKFTGPKREPTITTNAPPKTRKIEKTTETEKAIESPFSFFSDGFASLFSGSNVQSEIETRYSSQCSLSDKINQNSCCSPYDASPCCEYNQRIRRVFGIARFGLSRINLPQKRIVGGTPAGSLKTSVVYISKMSYDHQFCGGVLVHANWVLTAAHCFKEYCGMIGPNDLIVKVGKTTKDNFYYDFDEMTYNVQAIHCHAGNCKADGSPRINDIALVRLNRPVHFGHAVDIAQLPKPFDEPIMSKDCIMLGYGDTKGTGFSDVLKQVEIPLISNEQCNDERWRSCGVRSCMLCAGKENASPCSGDSGGPLFCPWHNGLYQLHGIYSYGRCGADRTKPAVFTRVSNYLDWIEETLYQYSDYLA